MILVIFLIKQQAIIPIFNNFPNFVSYCTYLCIPFIFTTLTIFTILFLSSDSVEGRIKEVKQANNAFLPSYLGYFFVALSIPSFETFYYVMTIIMIFVYVTQSHYFNPILILFNYHFYYITTENNVTIFLISKKEFRTTEGLVLPRLKRINNYTYIDIGG
jgi:hypothetical protein